MPHLEATNYFEHAYQAERYYFTYGCDKAEVARKIRDGEIFIGEPPERPGAIRRAPGGHFHYELPEETPPGMSEADLRKRVSGKNPRFTKAD
jgi:hypothetical protein